MYVTVSISTVIMIVTIVIIRINCTFQKFQSAFSGNFAQVEDILPFPVFYSERAPFKMEYFFLFVKIAHARLHLVAGSLPIGLQCPCV